MPDADHAHPTVLVKTAPSIRDAPAPSNHQSAGILTCDGFAQKLPKSHPRQWVDWFRSFLQTSSEANCNPTHGSGWILQILFRKEFEQSTTYRGLGLETVGFYLF